MRRRRLRPSHCPSRRAWRSLGGRAEAAPGRSRPCRRPRASAGGAREQRRAGRRRATITRALLLPLRSCHLRCPLRPCLSMRGWPAGMTTTRTHVQARRVIGVSGRGEGARPRDTRTRVRRRRLPLTRLDTLSASRAPSSRPRRCEAGGRTMAICRAHSPSRIATMPLRQTPAAPAVPSPIGGVGPRLPRRGRRLCRHARRRRRRRALPPSRPSSGRSAGSPTPPATNGLAGCPQSTHTTTIQRPMRRRRWRPHLQTRIVRARGCLPRMAQPATSAKASSSSTSCWAARRLRAVVRQGWHQDTRQPARSRTWWTARRTTASRPWWGWRCAPSRAWVAWGTSLRLLRIGSRPSKARSSRGARLTPCQSRRGTERARVSRRRMPERPARRKRRRTPCRPQARPTCPRPQAVISRRSICRELRRRPRKSGATRLQLPVRPQPRSGRLGKVRAGRAMHPLTKQGRGSACLRCRAIVLVLLSSRGRPTKGALQRATRAGGAPCCRRPRAHGRKVITLRRPPNRHPRRSRTCPRWHRVQLPSPQSRSGPAVPRAMGTRRLWKRRRRHLRWDRRAAAHRRRRAAASEKRRPTRPQPLPRRPRDNLRCRPHPQAGRSLLLWHRFLLWTRYGELGPHSPWSAALGLTACTSQLPRCIPRTRLVRTPPGAAWHGRNLLSAACTRAGAMACLWG
mmetsp:Transcript_35108/g.113091  ORF Transcript_35108/g.113091 Transcript_35108/m.113091 type:complete len:683 (-) Transcript_35108:749-2797(-)